MGGGGGGQRGKGSTSRTVVGVQAEEAERRRTRRSHSNSGGSVLVVLVLEAVLVTGNGCATQEALVQRLRDEEAMLTASRNIKQPRATGTDFDRGVAARRA